MGVKSLMLSTSEARICGNPANIRGHFEVRLSSVEVSENAPNDRIYLEPAFHDSKTAALRSIWPKFDKITHKKDPSKSRKCNRTEEHTSELQSLMRISYAVFCLKKKKNTKQNIKMTIHSINNTQQTH